MSHYYPPPPGYSAQPPGYPGGGGEGPSVFVISPPGGPVRLGRYSVVTTCPSCHRQVNTVVDRHSGCGAGLLAALLCCIG